jgi:hypothetical protein
MNRTGALDVGQTDELPEGSSILWERTTFPVRMERLMADATSSPEWPAGSSNMGANTPKASPCIAASRAWTDSQSAISTALSGSSTTAQIVASEQPASRIVDKFCATRLSNRPTNSSRRPGWIVNSVMDFIAPATPPVVRRPLVGATTHHTGTLVLHTLSGNARPSPAGACVPCPPSTQTARDGSPIGQLGLSL